MNSLRVIFLTTSIISMLLAVLPVYSQPLGYELVYSLPRSYHVDWMDVKAVYIKDERDRLYFYIEYYGAIPNSSNYSREIIILIDTNGDRDADYAIIYELSGDASYSSTRAKRWVNQRWERLWSGESGVMQAPGLSYMEVWLDKRVIGYIWHGEVGFSMWSLTYVWENTPKHEWNYVIGSSVKRINVDGDSSDWGYAAPLVTFPLRSFNPTGFEISRVYIANDDENLYFRIDTRERPTIGFDQYDVLLYQILEIYFDTDNDDNTGDAEHSGAEFKAEIIFEASREGESSRMHLLRYSYDHWFGSYEYDRYVSFSDFNNVFEFKIPFRLLGISSKQIGIMMESRMVFSRFIPWFGYELTFVPMEVYLLATAAVSVAILLVVRFVHARKGGSATTDVLKVELEKYEGYLRKLEDLRVEGRVSEQVYQALKKEYEAKIEELKKKLGMPDASESPRAA